jgi:hypothetical protein
MRDHERIFFVLCFRLAPLGLKPRAIIQMLNDTIPHNRCWYYLKKWSEKGIYTYGVTMDLGWFIPAAQMPDRYREILEAKK